jgi:hypothetical protein
LCAERLSDYKVPETTALRSEPLPCNANGKVMKRQLREAWAKAQWGWLWIPPPAAPPNSVNALTRPALPCQRHIARVSPPPGV